MLVEGERLGDGKEEMSKGTLCFFTGEKVCAARIHLIEEKGKNT